MNINRSNYEAWVIDYLDDQLTDSQRGELLVFLSQNPDLEAPLELVSLDDFSPLPADGEVETRFESLKIDTEFESKELWLAAIAEGDLAGPMAEAARRDPANAKTIDQLKAARLQADASVVYPAKATLKKSALVIQLQSFGFRAASIAAVLLIAAGVLFYLLREEPVARLAETNEPALRSDRDVQTSEPIESQGVTIEEPSKAEVPVKVETDPSPAPGFASSDQQEDGENITRYPQVSVERLAAIDNASTIRRLGENPERALAETNVVIPELEVAEGFADVTPLEPRTEQQTLTITEFLSVQAQKRMLGRSPDTGTPFSQALAKRAAEKVSDLSDGQVALNSSTNDHGRRSFSIRLGSFAVER